MTNFVLVGWFSYVIQNIQCHVLNVLCQNPKLILCNRTRLKARSVLESNFVMVEGGALLDDIYEE